MKFVSVASAALLLLLGTVLAHAQEGWDSKSFQPGTGKPEMKYHLVVPEGITITNKQGAVFKAGQVVVVPGANVTVLEPAYVEKQMSNTGFKTGFANEQEYFATKEKVRDYALVSVKVPEGVTVSGNGKTITGPSQVTFMVTGAGSQATPDTHSAETWNATGGWAGWGSK